MELEELEELVDRYISAYNRHDVDGLLELMHEGAAYYDAFWMENTVGRDLPQYLHDDFEVDTCWYKQIGGVMPTNDGVVYRYSANEQTDSIVGKMHYEGADVFTLLDGKILTISDFYCDPEEINLIEVAGLAAARHGLSNFTKSGLGGKKIVTIKRRLASLMDERKLYLDPTLTGSKLADQVGCSVEQLFLVMNVESKTEFQDILDRYRSGNLK